MNNEFKIGDEVEVIETNKFATEGEKGIVTFVDNDEVPYLVKLEKGERTVYFAAAQLRLTWHTFSLENPPSLVKRIELEVSSNDVWKASHYKYPEDIEFIKANIEDGLEYRYREIPEEPVKRTVAEIAINKADENFCEKENRSPQWYGFISGYGHGFRDCRDPQYSDVVVEDK